MLPKWTLPIAGLALVSMVSVACQPAQRPDDVNNRQNNALYQEEGTYGNRFIRTEDGGVNDNRFGPRNDMTRGLRGQNQIGFVRYSPDDDRGNNTWETGRQAQGPNIYVDRNALANHIGYLVTAFPQIKDATVLVTDDHVFVGVDDGEGKADAEGNDDAKGKRMDSKTVDQVRKTALSVTPRYYEVHVTDDETMRERLTEIGDRITNNGDVADYRDDISEILREMGDDTPPRPNGNRMDNNINNGINDFDDAGTGGRMNTGGNVR